MTAAAAGTVVGGLAFMVVRGHVDRECGRWLSLVILVDTDERRRSTGKHFSARPIRGYSVAKNRQLSQLRFTAILLRGICSYFDCVPCPSLLEGVNL